MLGADRTCDCKLIRLIFNSSQICKFGTVLNLFFPQRQRAGLNGFLQSGDRRISEGYSVYSGYQMRDNILQHQQYFELFFAV